VRRGAYLLSGHDGAYAVERFTASETEDGWRYVAVREHPATGADLGRIELLADDTGRLGRLEMTAGGWLLRGGVVGPEALWRRGGEERSEQAHAFTGSSPAFAVVCSRLAGAGRQLRLVAVHDASLATSTVDQLWAPAGSGWESTDLSTGERAHWVIDGGVVRQGRGVTLTTP
jgi:hypothetical protein